MHLFIFLLIYFIIIQNEIVIAQNKKNPPIQLYSYNNHTNNNYKKLLKRKIFLFNFKENNTLENENKIYKIHSNIYWDIIKNKRNERKKKKRNKQSILLMDYVLFYPPKISINLNKHVIIKNNNYLSYNKSKIPKIEDLINAVKKNYNFIPEFPDSEYEFMQNYVDAALKIGVLEEQIISLYTFETGGYGKYNLQAGIKNKNNKPISTAIGYNQLVSTATISIVSEFGKNIIKYLETNQAFTKNKKNKIFLKKISVLKKMIQKVHSIPHRWNLQNKLANTSHGLAIHSMILDKDIGPLLQLYKIKSSLNFLKMHNLKYQPSGVELEILNLSGDGNGLEMIVMPYKYRKIIPITNFFLRQGYEGNTILKNNHTVDKLFKSISKKIEMNINNKGTKILRKIFYKKKKIYI